MTLTNRTARTLATLLVLIGLAVPAASAGIDRGVDVEPWVAPETGVVSRYLANDQRHHPSAGASHLADNAPEVTRVRSSDSGSESSTALVALAILSSFALGAVATALLMRRRIPAAS